MNRKLKLQVQISIDGFIAGPNGEMDWMVWDWSEDLKEYVKKLTDSVDTIILGRKLAQGFIPHWGNVASDKNNPEYKAGVFFTNSPKIVFTKTLENHDWKNTVLAKEDLNVEVNKLKNKDGKDIIAYGGVEFVSNLIKEKLIDELHLLVNPAAIGNGLTIFNKLTEKQNFKLINSQAFNCGINVLVYSVENKSKLINLCSNLEYRIVKI